MFPTRVHWQTHRVTACTSLLGIDSGTNNFKFAFTESKNGSTLRFHFYLLKLVVFIISWVLRHGAKLPLTPLSSWTSFSTSVPLILGCIATSRRFRSAFANGRTSAVKSMPSSDVRSREADTVTKFSLAESNLAEKEKEERRVVRGFFRTNCILRRWFLCAENDKSYPEMA